MLLVLCNKENVTFVNQDENIKYRDNTPDMLLLGSDGLYLAAPSISKLLVNLRLKEDTVCSFGSGPTNRWQHSGQRVNLYFLCLIKMIYILLSNFSRLKMHNLNMAVLILCNHI